MRAAIIVVLLAPALALRAANVSHPMLHNISDVPQALVHSDVAAVSVACAGANGTAFIESPNRPPGYRSAWDDCGGAGASATERMRSITAKIKGWAQPRKFVRNAAQDAGNVHPSGTKPGPGTKDVYPARGVRKATREGLRTASDTLNKYKK